MLCTVLLVVCRYTHYMAVSGKRYAMEWSMSSRANTQTTIVTMFRKVDVRHFSTIGILESNRTMQRRCRRSSDDTTTIGQITDNLSPSSILQPWIRMPTSSYAGSGRDTDIRSAGAVVLIKRLRLHPISSAPSGRMFHPLRYRTGTCGSANETH
jgi:hypothetical protein